MSERLVKLAGLHDLRRVFESVNYTATRQFAPVITEVFVHVKISYSRVWHSGNVFVRYKFMHSKDGVTYTCILA